MFKKACIYYNRPEGCWKGEECKFLHGAPIENDSRRLKEVCKYFKEGRCSFGANCRMSHNLENDITLNSTFFDAQSSQFCNRTGNFSVNNCFPKAAFCSVIGTEKKNTQEETYLKSL
jgi:hypothetical protein